MKSLELWIAQGFGSGLAPAAPGTFGSLVGFAWLALLLIPASAPLFCIGLLLSIALSVRTCASAERALGETDPGSVVIDEIIAIPWCCVGWLLLEWRRHGSFPGLADVFQIQRLPTLIAVFALFRLFDIWKPWPVRGSQELPGGWGVTADDLLAALYVNLTLSWFV